MYAAVHEMTHPDQFAATAVLHRIAREFAGRSEVQRAHLLF